MGPTVIDKGQPIELIGSRLRDHTRTFDSGVRARTNPRRTLPGEGIGNTKRNLEFRKVKIVIQNETYLSAITDLPYKSLAFIYYY